MFSLLRIDKVGNKIITLSRFGGVTGLPPAENDNTEESKEEDDSESDGGEEEKVTIVETNIVQYFDDHVSCQVGRGAGRTEGGLEVTVTLLLLRVRRDPGGGGGGGLCRLCH